MGRRRGVERREWEHSAMADAHAHELHRVGHADAMQLRGDGDLGGH